MKIYLPCFVMDRFILLYFRFWIFRKFIIKTILIILYFCMRRIMMILLRSMLWISSEVFQIFMADDRQFVLFCLAMVLYSDVYMLILFANWCQIVYYCRYIFIFPCIIHFHNILIIFLFIIFNIFELNFTCWAYNRVLDCPWLYDGL